jgi:hypothetical protein
MRRRKGTKVRVQRRDHEIQRSNFPDLRIVPEELWAAVQDRFRRTTTRKKPWRSQTGVEARIQVLRVTLTFTPMETPDGRRYEVTGGITTGQVLRVVSDPQRGRSQRESNTSPGHCNHCRLPCQTKKPLRSPGVARGCPKWRGTCEHACDRSGKPAGTPCGPPSTRGRPFRTRRRLRGSWRRPEALTTPQPRRRAQKRARDVLSVAPARIHPLPVIPSMNEFSDEQPPRGPSGLRSPHGALFCGRTIQEGSEPPIGLFRSKQLRGAGWR